MGNDYYYKLSTVSKKEKLFLVILIVAYAIVAFWKLGGHVAPRTYYIIDSSTAPLVYKMDSAPTAIDLYPPVNDSSKYVAISIYGSADGQNWTRVFDTDDDQKDYTAAMIWYHYSLNTTPDMRYIKIDKHTAANRLALAEVSFRDSSNDTIAATAMTAGGEKTLDEPATVFDQSDRMNSAYFDESYFPSSALEMQDRLPVAEMDHPAVGRLIIGLGMDIWGRNPFGFRFMQVCFGILMLPLMYFFGRALFKSGKGGAMAATLLALDFMHYTQTRIGTLDAFLTFFILSMFAFLYFYHISTTKKWQRLFLLFSGIMTGLAIGTKWSGCYAALGLAILYFYWLISGWKKRDEGQKKAALRECGWCVLTFIAIPVCIYVVSYIPYAATIPGQGLFTTIINHTKQMYSYHNSPATSYHHPYSSKWWTWFLAMNPVFYYYQAATEVRIYASGNPMVWGMGLAGVLYALERGIAKMDDAGVTISVAYLSQLIPWFFITRDTFLYHYFPLVAFLILGVIYLFQHTALQPSLEPYKKGYEWVFMGLALAMFVIAFPFTYGMTMAWATVLTVRTAFLVIFGIMAALYVLLLCWDYAVGHPKKNKKKAPAEGAEDIDKTGQESQETGPLSPGSNTPQ